MDSLLGMLASMLPSTVNTILTLILCIAVWRIDRRVLAITLQLQYQPPCPYHDIITKSKVK